MPTIHDLGRARTKTKLAQEDRNDEARAILKDAVGFLTRAYLHIQRSKAPNGGKSMFADGDELDNAIEALNALVTKYEDD